MAEMIPTTCERCGERLDLVNITAFGEREQRWVAGRPCDCPGPRCFACGTRVDERGRCPNIDCYMLLNIIPIPDVW